MAPASPKVREESGCSHHKIEWSVRGPEQFSSWKRHLPSPIPIMVDQVEVTGKVFFKKNKTAEPTEKKFADLLLSPTFTPQSPREPGTQWKKEVALGAHKIGTPVPTGFSHDSDSAPQLSWAGHREDSHHPSRYRHFPWLKWGCSTVIPEAQIMHVRENKNSGIPSTKKQKKYSTYQPAVLLKAKSIYTKKEITTSNVQIETQSTK